jgi:hypothetical protein
MYWKVVGFNYVAFCKTCGEYFLFPKVFYCLFHPEKEMKHYGENLKYYKCCKQDDKRFTLIPGVKGCTSQMHNFEVTENLKNIYK